MPAKRLVRFWGSPGTISLFWSGKALYLNVTLLKFTLMYEPPFKVGGFRHASHYS